MKDQHTANWRATLLKTKNQEMLKIEKEQTYQPLDSIQNILC